MSIDSGSGAPGWDEWLKVNPDAVSDDSAQSTEPAAVLDAEPLGGESSEGDSTTK